MATSTSTEEKNHELKDSPIDPLDLYLARFTQRLAKDQAFVARNGTFYGDLAEIPIWLARNTGNPMDVEMGRKMKTPSIVWG